MEGGWVDADTWVLAAIAVYERPCSLTEVIASGDWINHAILLDEEVESALGRLAGAGLVRAFDDWTFELTDQGTSLWSGGRQDLHGHIDAVKVQLVGIEPGETPVKLPNGAMARALEEYRRMTRG